MDKVNILLVDDNPAKTACRTRSMLDRWGRNPRQGPFGPGRPCSVCSSTRSRWCCWTSMMPEMDGFETATLLRQHPRFGEDTDHFHHRLFLWSTSPGPGSAQRLRTGAVDYVFVPVVPESFSRKWLCSSSTARRWSWSP